MSLLSAWYFMPFFVQIPVYVIAFFVFGSVSYLSQRLFARRLLSFPVLGNIGIIILLIFAVLGAGVAYDQVFGQSAQSDLMQQAEIGGYIKTIITSAISWVIADSLYKKLSKSKAGETN